MKLQLLSRRPSQQRRSPQSQRQSVSWRQSCARLKGSPTLSNEIDESRSLAFSKHLLRCCVKRQNRFLIDVQPLYQGTTTRTTVTTKTLTTTITTSSTSRTSTSRTSSTTTTSYLGVVFVWLCPTCNSFTKIS